MNQTKKEISRNNFHIGYIPDKKNAKFKIKASYPTLSAAKQGVKDFLAKAAMRPFFFNIIAVHYDILTTEQVKSQWDKMKNLKQKQEISS